MLPSVSKGASPNADKMNKRCRWTENSRLQQAYDTETEKLLKTIYYKVQDFPRKQDKLLPSRGKEEL